MAPTPSTSSAGAGVASLAASVASHTGPASAANASMNVLPAADETEHDPDRPILAGMLAKRAQGRSHFGRLNWKQRWFELWPGELSYWTAEGGRFNPQAECKSVLDLDNVHAVEFMSFDAFNKTHMFQVVHDSILYVQCASKEECERWVKALRKQVMHNEFLHPKYHPGMFDEKEKHWTCCREPSKDIKGCQPAYNYQARRNRSARGRAKSKSAQLEIGSEPSSPTSSSPTSKRNSVPITLESGMASGAAGIELEQLVSKALNQVGSPQKPIVVRAVNALYV